MRILRIHAGLFMLSLLLMAVATSCRHKLIECPSAMEEMHVLFEWDRAEDADVAGMTLFFYPLSEHGSIWRFDIAGRDGGKVELPSGTYRMIACNNDLPGITLEDTGGFSSIRASARRYMDEGVYAGTGMLYDAVVSTLEVTPCGVRYVTSDGTVKECGRGLVRCRPDSLATEYSVMLTHVSGIERVRSATVILEGVRTSVFLDSGLPSASVASLAMNMSIDRQDAAVSGRGCAFAPSGFMEATYTLRLRIVRADGKTLQLPVEIKPEEINQITAHRVIITVDGIVIPDGGSSGDIGGIDAVVDGWEVIDIDVEPSF